MAARMEASQAGATTGAGLLRGVGMGYIGFALDEPGWFDVAVLGMPDMLSGPVTVPAAAAGADPASYGPYRLLAGALTALVREGRLPLDRVTDAAITCWSGVHGFSVLAAGPLRGTPRALLDDQAGRHVDTLVAAIA
jgi:hypothetical protein